MLRDRILIQDLEVRCIVGVYPQERDHEQVLRLDLELGVDLRVAGRSGELGHTCNYDQLADEVIALLRFRRYRLLEVAAEEVSAMLFGVHSNLEQVRLTIAKPMALPGRARAAAVAVERARGDFPRRAANTAFGVVETLLETVGARLRLLHVDGGRTLEGETLGPAPALEWRVGGELEREGELVSASVPTIRDGGAQAHVRYRNPSARRASIFSCEVERPGDVAASIGVS